MESIWDDLTDDEDAKSVITLSDNDDTKSLTSEHYLCVLCPSRFSTLRELQAHVSDHRREVLCKCNVCREMLKFPEVFNEHVKAHESDERAKSKGPDVSCECKVCGKIVRFPDNFSKHMQMHVKNFDLNKEVISSSHENNVRLGGYSVECRPCGEVFYTRSDFIRHINTVHKKTYTCEICNHCCGNYISFTLHRRLHSGQKGKAGLKRPADSEKVHKCTCCDKLFTYITSLRQHLKLQHHIEYNGDVRFTCDVCDKVLSSLTNLNNHKQLHLLNPNKCMYCRKSVSKPGFLKRHMRKHLAGSAGKNARKK